MRRNDSQFDSNQSTIQSISCFQANIMEGSLQDQAFNSQRLIKEGSQAIDQLFLEYSFIINPLLCQDEYQRWKNLLKIHQIFIKTMQNNLKQKKQMMSAIQNDLINQWKVQYSTIKNKKLQLQKLSMKDIENAFYRIQIITEKLVEKYQLREIFNTLNPKHKKYTHQNILKVIITQINKHFDQITQLEKIMKQLTVTFQKKFIKWTTNEIIIIKQIGKGAFSKIYQAIIQKNRNIALKKLNQNYIQEKEALTYINRQIKILSQIDHQHILKFFGFSQYQNSICYALQYCQEGDLKNKFNKNKTLNEKIVFTIIRQVLLALQYLHSKRVAHRDIKMENILISGGIIKLCDFGLAVQLGQGQFRQTYCGTMDYLAPQLIKRQCYNEKVDIWALGIMTYQLFTAGRHPFNITKPDDLKYVVSQQITYHLFSSNEITDEFKEFIQGALKKDPTQRFSASKLLKLSIVKRYQNEKIVQL